MLALVMLLVCEEVLVRTRTLVLALSLQLVLVLLLVVVQSLSLMLVLVVVWRAVAVCQPSCGAVCGRSTERVSW